MRHLITLFLALSLTTTAALAQILTGSVSNLGNENIDLTVSVDVANNSVTLTMEGPSNKWFAVGFGSSSTSMSGAYTTHVSSATFQMNERRHGGNNQGTALSSSGAVTSDVTSGGRRTVIFTRSRVGLTSNYYTFPSAAGSISIIWANGNSLSYGYHGNNRGYATLTLSEPCPPAAEVTLPVINICDGQSADVFGTSVNFSGLFADTILSSTGCDSIIQYQEVIANSSSALTDLGSISICQGESTTIFGNSENTAGIYRDTQTNSAGCDSVIQVELVVNPTYDLNETVQICSGDDYTFPDGTTQTNITASTTYTSPLSSGAGCDSLITTTVNPLSAITFDVMEEVCFGSDYVTADINLTNLTADTTVVRTYTASAGCDSTVTYTIMVFEQVVSISANAENTEATIDPIIGIPVLWQWFDCASTTAIAGEDMGSYTIPSDVMSIEVSVQGSFPIGNDTCVAVSNCVMLMNDTSTSIAELSAMGIQIFPNPSIADLSILNQEGRLLDIMITDMIGQVVYEGVSNESMLIKTSTWSEGVYSISIDVDGTRQSLQVIKR
ncbi:MAG: T9SS type A sorting domain-containing protein [Bacteroidota bacterium]|nr:T9SS type A sorting domain-containing protein [Bacteroidota bacterium]